MAQDPQEPVSPYAIELQKLAAQKDTSDTTKIPPTSAAPISSTTTDTTTVESPYATQLRNLKDDTYNPDDFWGNLVDALKETPSDIAHFGKQLARELTRPSIAELRSEQHRAAEHLGMTGQPAPTDADIHKAILDLAANPGMTGEEKFNAVAPFIPTFGLGYVGAQIGQSLFNAPDASSRGRVVGSFLGQFAISYATHFAGAKIGERVILNAASRARGVVEAARVADMLEQSRTYVGNGANVDEFIRTQTVRRQLGFPDPQSELEQASIKSRLLQEENGNVIDAFVRAHKQLTPNGTSVLPGLKDWSVILQADKQAPGISINKAIHPRADGLYDVAIYGDESPLVDDKLRNQFTEHGYFNGQVVSLGGRNYVLDNILSTRAVRLHQLSSPENVRYSILDLIRRPPYTRGSVFSLEGKLNNPIQPSQPSSAIDNLARDIDLRNVRSASQYKDTMLGLDADGDVTTRPMTAKEKLDAHSRTYATEQAVNKLSDSDVLAVSSKLGYKVSQTPEGFLVGDNNTGERYATLKSVDELKQFLLTRGEDGPLRQKQLGLATNSEPYKARSIAYRVGLASPDENAIWNQWQEYRDNLHNNTFWSLRTESPSMALPPLDEYLDYVGLKGYSRYIKGNINPDEAYQAFTNAVKNDGGIISQNTDGFITSYLKLRTKVGLLASWDRQVADFGAQYGYSQEQLEGIKRYLDFKQNTTNNKLYLNENDRDFLARNTKEIEGKYGSTLQSVLAGIGENNEDTPLSVAAYTNGMHLSVESSGAYALRDSKSGTLLGRFNTENGAREFISNSGQQDGIALDGGGNGGGINTPPNGGSPVGPPPAPHEPIDWLGDKPHRVEVFKDGIQWGARFIQNYRQVAISLDNIMESVGLRTHFSDNFADLSSAVNKRNVRIGPLYDELSKIDQRFPLKTKSERETVGRWIETASSSELGEEIGPEAVKYGEELADRNIDTDRVYKFRRALADIASVIQKNNPNITPEELHVKLGLEKIQLAKDMNIDQNHLGALDIYDQILKKDIKQVALHDVTRYTNTVLAERAGLDLTREGFAKANNMSPTQIALGNAISAFLDKVAKEVGFPEARRIFRYLAHYRTDPTPDFYDAFLRQKGIRNDAAAQFISEMTRSGEVNAYELDPVKVALRYATGMINSKELIPVWNKAKDSIIQDIGMVPEKFRDEAHNIFNNGLLAETRGFPDAGVKATQAGLDNMWERLGWGKAPNFSRNIVSALLSIFSNWAIGLRPMMGLRHFWAVNDYYVGRFGLERARDMVSYMGNKESVNLAKAKGALGEFNPGSISEPTDVAQSKFQEGVKKLPHYINKAAEIGLKGSGLKAFYDWTKAAVFNETLDLANKELLAGAYGEKSWNEVHKNLSIESYERPFINRFHDLVQTGRYTEAAESLARETAEETVASYSQLHRVGRWRNNIGRVFGQFGVFPLWSVNQTLRSLSRGSLGYITGVVARRAGMQAALYGVSQATGLNLSNWYFWHGFGWRGGPLPSGEAANLGHSVFNLMTSPISDDQDAADKAVKRLPPLAVQDWMDAFDMEKDYTPIQRAGRALGLKAPQEDIQ